MNASKEVKLALRLLLQLNYISTKNYLHFMKKSLINPN